MSLQKIETAITQVQKNPDLLAKWITQESIECITNLKTTELFNEPLDIETFTKGISMLETEKGLRLSNEKFRLMFNELRQIMNNRTFKETTKNLLKVNTYMNISISDFVRESEKLPKFYNRIWYEKTISEFPNAQIDIYLHEKTNQGLYKFSDGTLKKYPNLKPIFVNGKYVKESK